MKLASSAKLTMAFRVVQQMLTSNAELGLMNVSTIFVNVPNVVLDSWNSLTATKK